MALDDDEELEVAIRVAITVWGAAIVYLPIRLAVKVLANRRLFLSSRTRWPPRKQAKPMTATM